MKYSGLLPRNRTYPQIGCLGENVAIQEGFVMNGTVLPFHFRNFLTALKVFCDVYINMNLNVSNKLCY